MSTFLKVESTQVMHHLFGYNQLITTYNNIYEVYDTLSVGGDRVHTPTLILYFAFHFSDFYFHFTTMESDCAVFEHSKHDLWSVT